MFNLLVDGELLLGLDNEVLFFYSKIEAEMFLEDLEISKNRALIIKKDEEDE